MWTLFAAIAAPLHYLAENSSPASNELFRICQFWPVVKGGPFSRAPSVVLKWVGGLGSLCPFCANIGTSSLSLGIGSRIVIEAGSLFSFELSSDVRERTSVRSGRSGFADRPLTMPPETGELDPYGLRIVFGSAKRKPEIGRRT
jgi:hypothetical protein